MLGRPQRPGFEWCYSMMRRREEPAALKYSEFHALKADCGTYNVEGNQLQIFHYREEKLRRDSRMADTWMSNEVSNPCVL